MNLNNDHGPDPENILPIKGNRNLQFIKPTITNENILVGEYSYYDSKRGESFEDQVLYHYEVIGDKLIIGRFCSIGPGTTFIMNGANHRMDGSTYPFHLFRMGWEKYMPSLKDLPLKGDIEIGNDVWIGRDVTIMPGVKIGDGAIIAAEAVVTKNVAPYSIVGGNPLKFIRKRFSDGVIEEWLALQWWNLDMKIINENLPFIINGDIEMLKRKRKLLDDT
uniref:Virginiamycin A acetyltransferase n=5 Tax=Staphylococcus aureus TaxID=1280 RepID=VATA_STAAU|nr:streptogramin A O-acetyltransferase Vat(A) [Staphylococcus aureus]P26839.2 RecName: Full=Virginiamycin A acetyltransferase [Staphylococcus aureus]AAA26683.1 acetyltransferase [Staphylococcus aureus]AAF24087.1 acetyltransferase Vat [Staphylococcus aureus]